MNLKCDKTVRQKKEVSVEYLENRRVIDWTEDSLKKIDFLINIFSNWA